MKACKVESYVAFFGKLYAFLGTLSLNYLSIYRLSQLNARGSINRFLQLNATQSVLRPPMAVDVHDFLGIFKMGPSEPVVKYLGRSD